MFIHITFRHLMRFSKKTIFKILGGLFLSILLILGGATFLLNTPNMQQRLLAEATHLLSERFGTEVKADSISVNFFSQRLSLYGLNVKDQKGQDMLQMKELAIAMNLKSLWNNSVVVEDVETDGTKATLRKDSIDAVANYQFIIDSLRSKPHKVAPKDSKSKKIHLDIQYLSLKNLHISYARDERLLTGSFKELLVDLKKRKEQISIEGLRYQTDYHRPRKNTGRPHRGFFDPGHYDIVGDMKWTVHTWSDDSIKTSLDQCHLSDSISGIDLQDLHFDLAIGKKTAKVSNLVVRQKNTELTTRSALIQLPSKKEGRKLSYTTDTIHGHVILQDISRAFAPALNQFKLPLKLRALMYGEADSISFPYARVSTEDNRLQISSTGQLRHLKGKHKLIINFNVSRMLARKGVAEKVINQFKSKKLMMKQVNRLGNISYTGSFDIVWRHEEFRGHLNTAVGPLDFSFALDGNSKYLSGNASFKELNLGQALDVEKLGTVKGKGYFKIDISKVRTAKMRKNKGGKLPIGTVNATIDDCSYGGIHLHNLKANIDSDGAEAIGEVKQQGRLLEFHSKFAFTDTDKLNQLVIIKPGIKFTKKGTAQKEGKKKRERKKKEKKE